MKRKLLLLFFLIFNLQNNLFLYASKASDNSLPQNYSSVDYSKYMRDLQRQIKAQWNPSRQNAHNVIVEFTLTKKGKLLLDSIKIINSSGEKDSIVAKNAIIKASKYFHPLPKGSPEQVKVEFTFKLINPKTNSDDQANGLDSVEDKVE